MKKILSLFLFFIICFNMLQSGSELGDEMVGITIRMPRMLFNDQMDRFFSGQIVEKGWPSQLDASWRETYQQNTTGTPLAKGCPFCHQIASNEDDCHLIIKRTGNFIVMLNKFPYAKGHLMVISNAHIQEIEDLNVQGRAELIDLLIKSKEILKQELHVDSFNIGINLGMHAGASQSHLHWHIVPRCSNERLSFMNTVAQTNIIQWDQDVLCKQLRIAFSK